MNKDVISPYKRGMSNVRDILGVPVAVISLVGREEQWFKAVRGLPVCSTEREVAFCATAMYEPHGLAVSDARNDERFESNRLVRGEPGIRSRQEHRHPSSIRSQAVA